MMPNLWRLSTAVKSSALHLQIDFGGKAHVFLKILKYKIYMSAQRI